MYLYVLKVLKKFVLHCTKNEKLLHFVHLLRKKIFSINRREEHLEKEEKRECNFLLLSPDYYYGKWQDIPRLSWTPFWCRPVLCNLAFVLSAFRTYLWGLQNSITALYLYFSYTPLSLKRLSLLPWSYRAILPLKKKLACLFLSDLALLFPTDWNNFFCKE